MNSLSKVLLEIRTPYSDLGYRSGLFLSYSKKEGWSYRSLTPFQQLIRKLFGLYKETHFKAICTALLLEKNVSELPHWEMLAKRLNKILYQREIQEKRSLEWEGEKDQKGPVLFRSTIKPNNFLSNFFPTLVVYNERFYSSVEVAYQALKFINTPLYEKILFGTSKESKIIADQHKNEAPADWANKKLQVMQTLLKSKFDLNKDLKRRLLATENRPLVEHTDDNFWGDGNLRGEEVGNGANHLGRLLEITRAHL